MGNFANTLFSVLLGWVQSMVAWLWEIIGADGAQGLMGWVLDNWLALAVILCLLGLGIDLVVYLIRWQPYRMWGRRKKAAAGEASEAAPEPADAPEEALQWLYADGVTEPGTEPGSGAAPQAYPTGPVQRVIPARRRRSAAYGAGTIPPEMEAQPGYNRPYYPPQWRAGDQQDGGTQG